MKCNKTILTTSHFHVLVPPRSLTTPLARPPLPESGSSYAVSRLFSALRLVYSDCGHSGREWANRIPERGICPPSQAVVSSRPFSISERAAITILARFTMSQAFLISDPVPTVSIHDGRPATTSLEVARFFGKQHQHVIRDITGLTDNCPESFSASN